VFVSRRAGLRRTQQEWANSYSGAATQALDIAGNVYTLGSGVTPLGNMRTWASGYLAAQAQDLNLGGNAYALSGITPTGDMRAWSSSTLFSTGRVDLNIGANTYGLLGVMANLTDIVTTTNSGGMVLASGTWSAASSNTMRRSELGGLFEAERTNTVKNTFANVVASDGVELLTNNLFSTDLTGWTVAQPGTSTVAWFSAGMVDITGDGTNTATLQQSFSVVSGRTYTLQTTTLLGTLDGIKIGTTAGANDVLNQTTIAAGSNRQYTFTPAATGTVYLTFAQTTAVAVRIVLTSIQWQTVLPPSPWQITNLQGVLIQVAGKGTANGLPYVDYRFYTPGGATTIGGGGFYFDSSTGIPAVQGQTFGLSANIARVAGSTTGLTNFNFVGTERPNGVANTGTSFLGILTSTLQRYTYTPTITGATATNIQPSLAFTYPIGSAFDITLRIQAPMVTLGGDTGSPILVSTTPVTRTADQAIEGLSTGFSAGTIVIYGTAPTFSAQTGLWVWDDGTTNNAILVYRDATGVMHGKVTAGGVQRCDLILGTVANGFDFRLAFGWDSGGAIGVLNGAAAVTASLAALPTGLVTIRLGCDSSGNYWGSYITRSTLLASKVGAEPARSLTT